MKKSTLFLLVSLIAAGCAGTLNSINQNSFSSVQSELIISGNADSSMRIFTVNNYQDSVLLRTKSEDIIPDSNDAELRQLVKRMYATVTDTSNDGVGIAAPQVGILKNIIWVQRYDKPDHPFEVYFNPKIRQYTQQKLSWVEGCLSIPGKRDTTNQRSYAIFLEYQKLDNSRNIEMIEGFTAIIFQHEIDHLNGILYIDRKK